MLMGKTIREEENRQKMSPKTGPKKRARGPPGRGVLRFWRRAYRRPVHFLLFLAIFSKKVQT